MESAWLAILGTFNVAGLVAIISLLLKLGKLWGVVEDGKILQAGMSLKLDVIKTDLVNHKVEVAREYATRDELKGAIDAFRETVRDLNGTMQSYVIALAKKSD